MSIPMSPEKLRRNAARRAAEQRAALGAALVGPGIVARDLDDRGIDGLTVAVGDVLRDSPSRRPTRTTRVNGYQRASVPAPGETVRRAASGRAAVSDEAEARYRARLAWVRSHSREAAKMARLMAMATPIYRREDGRWETASEQLVRAGHAADRAASAWREPKPPGGECRFEAAHHGAPTPTPTPTSIPEGTDCPRAEHAPQASLRSRARIISMRANVSKK